MKLQDYMEKRSTLSNIKRFNMETVIRPQNLCEHGHGTATIFYLLCYELNVIVTPDALFKVLNHDFAETYTGDLNRYIKDKNETTKEAWKILEKESLPDSLKCWTDTELEKSLGKELFQIFQISDELDAYLYCREECRMGNSTISEPMLSYSLKLKGWFGHHAWPFIIKILKGEM